MAYLGEDIPKLGFGLMRLPMKDGSIDIAQTCEMVDRFMAAGYTYFDTAWAYKGSEAAIREALVHRYPRESFQLASKNAAWINCRTQADALAQFETSLRETDAGYFDYYLLHNLGDSRTKVFEDLGLWELFSEMKESGKIRHLGFSIHATADQLVEILDKHPETEFVQLQINYADWEDASVQSGRCYEVCRSRGIPVIVMEPVKGGLLAHPPAAAAEILREADPSISSAAWAIRFCADLEGIITVLSGMSDISQMEDSLACMEGFTHLSETERDALVRARDVIRSAGAIPCTSCNYCSKVCPENVGISPLLTCMNYIRLYDDSALAERHVGVFVDKAGRKRGSSCIGCGACEDACPQHLGIIELLKESVKYFG